MDDRNAPTPRSTQPTPDTPAPQGGTVEPAQRAPVAIRSFQTPETPPAERFELRDPFTDLTYRSDRYQDMDAKADQLGASRFVVLDAKGRRSFAHKVGGQWRREEPKDPQRTVAPETKAPPKPARAAKETPSKEVPLQPAASTSREPEAIDPQALARMDAQAERAALVARLEAALLDRYLIKRAPVSVGAVSIGLTEYRFKGDNARVAFTETTFRLATETNSPSVARSMVDVAEARNWQSLRVTGSEDFKRLVWLEAAARGVKALGYDPNPADLERLKVERELRQVNRIEPGREASASPGATPNDKPAGRGNGGRKAVLAAIDAILVAKRVPEKQREAIMAAATEKLAQRIRDGHTLKVKVYDPSAPSQRPVVAPKQEQQRTRERAAPAR